MSITGLKPCNSFFSTVVEGILYLSTIQGVLKIDLESVGNILMNKKQKRMIHLHPNDSAKHVCGFVVSKEDVYAMYDNSTTELILNVCLTYK